MNFKSIEMVGFKSFADPIKVNFEDGITAIVGPNGCGKSNVADAIRWVLGEQSTKTLRAGNMQDVIFKGTEKRKSLSFCEVSLCFDNSNKIFRSDLDEITISRKLYRNGESDYLINDTLSRRRDIVEIIRDSGLGSGGYSIIGQESAKEIISKKPEDRRAIFEEAAGTAKFRDKKDEAERKLERTNDNLTRINDIVAEIERQLVPLRRQSETAKKYLELKEQLKLFEVNAYIYQYDNASENKSVIIEKMNQLTDELDAKATRLQEVQDEYNENFDSLSVIDQSISKLRDEILNYRVSIEKHAGESNLIAEKLNNLKNEGLRLQAEYDSLKEQNVADARTIDDETEKRIALCDKLDSLQKSLNISEEKYNEIASELKSSESEAQEAQQKIFDTLSKLGDVKAQISALETEKSTYSNRIKELEVQLIDCDKKLTDSAKNKGDAEMALEMATKNIRDYSAKVHDLMEAQTTKMNEIKLLEGDIGNDVSSFNALSNRKKILEDMQREFEGFQGSVRKLLTDADKNQELKNKIVGVFANLITIPSTLQTAIEMALGAAVQNVVTVNEDSAKHLINYLKQKEYGRVTFLPINAIKPRYFDRNLEKYLSTKGCLGLASNLIEYDKSIANIVSSFLGNIVIVDNINTAVALAKQSSYAFKIVTLEGDIINPMGSMTGGSKKSQVANLLSRESDIENATKMMAKLEIDIKKKRSSYDLFQAQLKTINDDIKINTEKLRGYEIAEATENERLDKFSTIWSDFDTERNKCQSEISKSRQILDTITSKLSEMSETKDNFHADNTVVSTQFSELREKRDEYSNEIMQLKIDIASTNSEIINIDNDIDRINSDIRANNTRMDELIDEIKQNQEIVNSFKSAGDDQMSSSEVDECRAKLKESQAKVEELEKKKIDNSAIMRRLEEERLNLNAEISRIQDKKYQQESALTKIDTDIETLQERVWTEYELTYNTALDFKQEFFDLKSGLANIARLKKEINALGFINVNAIEDCKELEARHGTYFDQAQDLIKAQDDLRKIIKELCDEMVGRFKTEFDEINKNFGIVFKELFGGGNAKLTLTEPNDILNSGVDIAAEPPGKKLSNISLLSGGEKALTAIAIILAIMRRKPMPFCLLDEIEAPLDEANVDRFARYIKKYSDKTQFIVITHKKPTMEYADTLYGVTMEEKGVSKIVSVKLSEAINQAQE